MGDPRPGFRPQSPPSGNVLLLVSDWPEEWEALDHRIAGKCGWAWRVEGRMTDHGIDPDVMLDQDGRQCLLAMLVGGATRSYHQFHATKEQTGIGDPSQVAANDYSRACAEDLRVLEPTLGTARSTVHSCSPTIRGTS